MGACGIASCLVATGVIFLRRCVDLSNKIIWACGPLPGYIAAASCTRLQCCEHASCSIFLLSRVGANSNRFDDLSSERSFGGNVTFGTTTTWRKSHAAPFLQPHFANWCLQNLLVRFDTPGRISCMLGQSLRLHPLCELKSRQMLLVSWAISHSAFLHPPGVVKS